MIATVLNPLPALLFQVGSVALAALLLGRFIHRRVFVVPIAFLVGSLAFFCAGHVRNDFGAVWEDLFWEPIFEGHLVRNFPHGESNMGFVMFWLIPLGLAYWITGWASRKQQPDNNRMHQTPGGAGDP
jgi:hypothetical protein